MLCLTVVLAVVLLALATCFPQQFIDANVAYSAEIMIAEGVYPSTLDRTRAGTLDNWTDALMLMESKAMTSKNVESIFSNPLFIYGGENPVENLYEYVNDDDPLPTGGYVRYWMGFRVILRFLLVFLNYYQIKRYVSFALFALFALLICKICSGIDSKTAFAFAISIILVRPYIICYSLQFSCCFLIAFVAMLLVPKLAENQHLEKLFFMEVGIITMYFDFYTTPVITLGLPLIYLYLLRNKQNETMPVKQVLTVAVMWFIGYVLMWISKLVLTSVFTSYDGVTNGLNSMIGCLFTPGPEKNTGILNMVNLIKNVALTVFSDKAGLAIGLIILSALLTLAILMIRKGLICCSELLKHRCLLIIAAMPFAWFVVAAKPTAVHAWFQYRSVVVFYWGLFCWLLISHRQNEVSRNE